MGYCKTGEKAIVSFKFADKQEDKFTTDKTPIDIKETHDGVTFSGGQCPCMVYKVTATAVQSDTEPFEVENSIWGAIINTRVTRKPESEIFQNGDPNECFGVFGVLCRGVANGYEGCQDEYVWRAVWSSLNCKLDIDFINIKVVPKYPESNKDNCGSLQGNCKIDIYSQGNLLLSRSGKSPCNVTVSCGDDCPPGYCKCTTTNYPGYCCIPCKEIKAQLIASRIAVRSLKNG